MTTVHNAARRQVLQRSAIAAFSGLSGLGAALPTLSLAQTPAIAERQFSPTVGEWRTFDVTTRVDLAAEHKATQLWIPMPSLATDWQMTTGQRFDSNGQASVKTLLNGSVNLLHVTYEDRTQGGFAEVTSRIKTRNRRVNWSQPSDIKADTALIKEWTAPSRLLPTDGIVLTTARKATEGATSDIEKVQRIYDWVVTHTFREPKVRGCGEGDIKSMLETGNLSGKCADLNALFVGLCRAAGLPARDVYGLRVAPSAFPYKELGGNSSNLKGAQHCRAEVFLAGFGWVAMDPADVTKVMRQETPEWIKSVQNPIVAPVNKALFGSWEGNWMAFNSAHDVALPGSGQEPIGFLMYPVAENAAGRIDSYAPDAFKYQITAVEVKT